MNRTTTTFLLALATAASLDLSLPSRASAQETETIELDPKAQKQITKEVKRRDKKWLAKARKHLKRHPEDAARYEPANGVDPASSTEVTFPTAGGGEQTVKLDPIDSGLLDLGSRQLDGLASDNLEKLYATIHAIVPQPFLQDVPEPGDLRARSSRAMARASGPLLEAIDRDFAAILDSVSQTLPGSILTLNFIDDCTAELGFEAGGDEVSDRCDVADYASDGILGNVDFVLKDDITCVRNQGQRGTCVAHGVTAALESQVLVNGGNAKTLSEQRSYLFGKIFSDWPTRYDDGLTTAAVLEAFDDEDVRTPFERTWDYNLSIGRGAFDPATNQFPNSCLNYNGEACTDYSFQTDEIVSPLPLGGLLFTYPVPTAPVDQGNEITDYTTIPDLRDFFPGDVSDLTLALLLLEAEKPVIASVQVPPSFRTPDANGYVQHVGGQQSSGNHLVLMVGFVANADLPANAPPDPAGIGYFVIKNSWGIGYGDCGFSYLSFEFLDNWRNSLWYLADDVD